MKKLLHDPKFRYGSLSTAILCLGLALLFALNGLFTALEKQYGWRVDCSFNAITTHSQSTREVLEALPYPVHIYALYERGSEDLPLFELLDRYRAASDLVTWEQAPISLNPTFLTRFAGLGEGSAVTQDSLVVWCETTERFRVLDTDDFLTLSGDWSSANLTYESAITGAIAYVTRETIPVVWMAQGHDELTADDSAALETLLLDNHYDVRYTTLARMDLHPDDLLVFLAPTRDLTDSELALVTDFTGQGGAVLFACDWSDPINKMPNYQALLRSYGFLPLEGTVVSARGDRDHSFEGNRSMLLPNMQPTEITLNLMLTGLDTLILPTARAFQTPESTDSGLSVTPMLLSGEGSHLRSLTNTSATLDRADDEAEGPFAVALEAYRFSPTGDVSRAVAIGSTATLTSEYYYAMTHAQEFIIRTMEYLVGGSASNLNIMARSAVRPALSANALTLGCLMLVALPLSVALAAFLILSPRRHR